MNMNAGSVEAIKRHRFQGTRVTGSHELYQSWELVTEHGISAGAVCTLNAQVISLATRRLLLFPLEVKSPYKISVLFDKRKHSQFIAFVKILLCR